VLTNLYPNPLQPNRATFNRQQFRALAAEHEVRVIAPVAWTDEWSRRRRRMGVAWASTLARGLFSQIAHGHEYMPMPPRVLLAGCRSVLREPRERDREEGREGKGERPNFRRGYN